MQSILQTTQRIMSICLVTLLIVTNVLTILPTPAKADIVIVKCEQGSNCGNTAAFAAGVASGSVVTLMATGHTATLAVTGAAIGQAVTTVIAPLTAPAVAAAAPVVLPIAATAAVGYVGYHALRNHHDTQTKTAS